MRRVGGDPLATSFKPRGIPSTELEEITLSLDEFEAIRLADLEGLYQEDAAARMGVSRQTFGNIICAAHLKVADFLIHGKHLLIEGGPVTQDIREFRCLDCGHVWKEPFGTGRPRNCPSCRSTAFRRQTSQNAPSPGDRGPGPKQACCREPKRGRVGGACRGGKT